MSLYHVVQAVTQTFVVDALSEEDAEHLVLHDGRGTLIDSEEWIENVYRVAKE